MNTATPLQIDNPYTGLRPFDETYAEFFFGRDQQVRDLYAKLMNHRFVAILGYSGSGKSSLVKCGLIPHLAATGNRSWKHIVCRPGSSPLLNLANALSAHTELYDQASEMSGFIHSLLGRSSKGLTEAIDYSGLRDDEHLFILIDQFEELFRFRKYEERAQNRELESMQFANLLVNTVESATRAVHIGITMRSEFLGECARFQGLPEIINQGQYLIPPMSRAELKAVITGPVTTYNKYRDGDKVNMSRGLVERALNDVKNDQDLLPILQHTLRRTWEMWQQGSPEKLVGLDHYVQAGQMKNALNNHADKLYESLRDGAKKKLCEKIFKSLTEKNNDGIETRRPVRLKELTRITQADKGSILEIVQVFQQQGSFLEAYEYENEQKGERDLVVDISHESLMRKWTKLRRWVKQETDDAAFYFKLGLAAKAIQENKGDLLSGNDLAQAVKWWSDVKPNAEWAKRYDDLHEEFINFNGIASFVKMSEKSEKRKQEYEEKKQRRKRQRRKIALIASGLGFLASVIIALIIFFLKKEADSSREVIAGQYEELKATKKGLEVTNRTLDKAVEDLNRSKKELEVSINRLDLTNRDLETSNQTLVTQQEELKRRDQTLRLVNGKLRRDSLRLAENNTALLYKEMKLNEQKDSLMQLNKVKDSLTMIETSRNYSLNALKYLELGALDRALDLATRGNALIKDSLRTPTGFSNENYQAMEAVWNRKNAMHREYRGHNAGVRALAISGSLLVSADADGSIHICNYSPSPTARFVTKQQQLEFADPFDRIADIAIGPEHEKIYFTTRNGKVYATARQRDGVFSALAAYGGYAFPDRSLTVTDAEKDAFFTVSGITLFKGTLSDTTPLEAIETFEEKPYFLEIDRGVVIVGYAGKVALLNADTGSPAFSVDTKAPVSAAALIPGRLLVLGLASGEIVGYPLAKAANGLQVSGDILKIESFSSPVSGLDLMARPNGRLQLAAASLDRTAYLLELGHELTRNTAKLNLLSHHGWIHDIVYDSRSLFAATIGEDKIIHFWPVEASQAADALKTDHPNQN